MTWGSKAIVCPQCSSSVHHRIIWGPGNALLAVVTLALKGLNKSAQGNALGLGEVIRPSPERAE